MMKNINNKGWGMATMVGFLIGFAIFLIVIFILSWVNGLL